MSLTPVLTIFSSAEPPRRHEIAAGRAVVFHGCRTGCCPPADPSVTGAAGIITTTEQSWSVLNTSTASPIQVWDLENSANRVTVGPGLGMAPPWDLAGIGVANRRILTVHGPRSTVKTTLCSGWTLPAWGLDPASRAHEVMVTLVAQQMAGDASVPLPTAREIGQQLGVSHRTVHEHLRHLVTVLGIEVPNHRKTGWVTSALADFALTVPYIPVPGTEVPWLRPAEERESHLVG